MRIFIVALALLAPAATAFAQQKTIKSPAEYDAYMAALNAQDPAQKAAAMEAFAAAYPNSVVHMDALDNALAAYQAAGNAAKVSELADRILQEDPSNARALAIAAVLRRAAASQGDKKAGAELGSLATRGLEALPSWAKPDGVTDAQYAELRAKMRAIFEGAAAFAALQASDYGTARAHYLKSLEADPDDMQNTYQLSIAELKSKPQIVDGFWHAARAMQLCGGNAAGRAQIERWAKAVYAKYHGSADGWDDLVKAAAGQTSVPDGFAESITKA